MPSNKKNYFDYLFFLIKNLSKSEKRNFRIYVNRIKKNKCYKYLELFEIINSINIF
ncbi:hypothetical protein [Blattabacterium cuenoti]|uniref:hypothetical protein n=1 Tax=Blattabacterium cuenoti TaxID=1653831 RepID=UPI001EEAC1DF|nr:hypothetical protein [Blattabacterium cuenoti]